MTNDTETKIRSDPKICDYGCGQEAKYQFKNGKWCCSKTTNGCPNKRKKLSLLKKNKSWEEIYGKEYSEYFKKKRRKDLIGKSYIDRYGEKKSIEIKQKISNKNKNKKISESHKLCISLAQKDKMVSIEQKEKQRSVMIGRKDSLKTKKLKSQKQLNRYKNSKEKNKFKISIKQIQERYPTFVKIEEMRYEPGKENEKVIQVHCKNHNCLNSKEKGGWFNPIYRQLYERIRQIEDLQGNQAGYLYCCKECKEECPLYRKTVNQLIKEDQIAAGIIEDPWYTTGEFKTWRDHIYKLDDGKCVWCGKPAEHAHHIMPQKTHPELSLDPDNGVACCRECHYKYGHRDRWCTTGYLSTLVCERIIRIKGKLNENSIDK